MQQFKSLPMAARIGIPVVLALAIIGLAFMMMSRGATYVTITTVNDADTKDATVWKLKQDKITPNIVLEGDSTWKIQVLPKQKAEAQASIDGTGLQNRMTADTTTTCTEPGSLGSTAQQDRYSTCVSEHKITDFANKNVGVLAANTTVTTEDSGALLGSDRQTTVSLQLFTDPKNANKINASAMAEQIAYMVPGGSVDKVMITNASGDVLWSKSSTTSGANGGAGSACTPATDQVVDITTKEQQVSDCLEEQIKQQLAQLVGSPDHVVVTANAILNPSAQSVSTSRISAGATTTKSETTSNGTSSTDATVEPNKETTQSETIAGYIKNLRITVALDSRFVSPSLEKIVRDQLQAYYVPARGDLPPSVRSAEFATPAPSAKAAATGGAAAATKADTTAAATSKSMSKTILIVAGLLIAGLITTIVLLMRRSSRERAERERMEREFSSEQNMFMNFAQENPADLARELNELLGSPSA